MCSGKIELILTMVEVRDDGNKKECAAFTCGFEEKNLCHVVEISFIEIILINERFIFNI